MNRSAQIQIPATWMRGGTSKGVFFKLTDLPDCAQQAGAARDALLLRVIGSPDPYGRQIDGLGGATSSTSKVVIVSRSERPDHHLDYLFGQVAIDRPVIDWSGNCGNLTAAVPGFAIHQGIIRAEDLPPDGPAEIRIWQANIGKSLVTHLPMQAGRVQESGDFHLDGVTFPAAEIRVDFLDPAAGGQLLPTGRPVDSLEIPGLGAVDVSLIDAGIPMIFIDAARFGLTGTERQEDINNNDEVLGLLESVRAHGALKLGLISALSEAANRPHSPKIAWVAPASDYVCSTGSIVAAGSINLLVRALSMGSMHHAMMGTAAVAIGAAAAIPGTLVNQAAGGGAWPQLSFGHPSGILTLGTEVSCRDGDWVVHRASMSRSARTLMDGCVHIPAEVLAEFDQASVMA